METYCFLLIPSGYKTRSSLIQNLSRFSRWKSLHRQFCSISISVKILETVFRQSEVLAHRKKCFLCKVTPVSIQTFVEGLRRIANVLEATHVTLLPIVVLGLEMYAHINRFLRLFGCLKATMGGSGKTLDSLEFCSTNVKCSRMVLRLFLRQGWYVRTQGVLLHFCISLCWSKLLLEMLWALLKLFLIILCL
jgi:hypothetical protein